jgi:hypothetical protein
MQGEYKLTWIPSIELSSPPDEDLIYGCRDDGWRQLSFSASMRVVTLSSGVNTVVHHAYNAVEF